MARSRPRKLFDTLRRMIRRRRAPSPSEHEWLRLILVLRRLQQGQIAALQRLDGVRGLPSALGAFRGDFRALHADLAGAREAAEHLERGLGERLQKLDGLPDPTADRQALDKRLAKLDELTARLAHAGEGHGPDGAVLGETLEKLATVAARLEAASDAERAQGAQDELAQLYGRIQELAEAMAKSPRARGAAGAAEIEALGERIEGRLAELESALMSIGGGTSAGALETRLAPLEQLSERLTEQLEAARAANAAVPDAGGHADLLARMEALAARIEAAPVLLPELPPDALAGGRPLGVPVEEFEALRASLNAAQEAHRRAEAELEALRGQLRASELARIELETRHSRELSEIADHAGKQLQRIEEDLKKKKRGLAEITQQNIQLQNLVARLQQDAGNALAPARSAPTPPPLVDPPAALPRAGPRPRTLHEDG